MDACNRFTASLCQSIYHTQANITSLCSYPASLHHTSGAVQQLSASDVNKRGECNMEMSNYRSYSEWFGIGPYSLLFVLAMANQTMEP